jgi:hypothetical protein
MSRNELYNKILDKYGLDAMKLVWLEELHELSTVILQSMRHKGTREELTTEALIHEMADVRVCLDQMCYMIGKTNTEIMWARMNEVFDNLPKKLKL